MDDLRGRLKKYDDYTPPAGGRRPVPSLKTEEVEPQPFINIDKKPKKPKKNKQPKKAKRKNSKRILIIAIGVIMLVCLGLLIARQKHLWIFRKHVIQVSTGETSGIVPPKSTQSTSTATQIRLAATGDMIPYSAVLHDADKGNGTYDFTYMFSNMVPFFTHSDVRVCSQPTPAGGAPFGISGNPTFNAPLAWPLAIENSGCNVINMASNNMNDKSQPAIDASVAAWDNRSHVFAVAGANRSVDEQNKVRYFTAKGLKFAFVAYTTSTNNKQITPFGVNMYNDTLVQTQMKEARKQADFVIVAMHWGAEDSNDINAEQDTISQQLTDLGADVVIGTGAHRLQPTKILNSSVGHQTLVWYSLGNSINAQLPIESLIGGIAVMDIDIASKKIVNTAFMPTYMHYEWTADQKQKNDLLSRKNFVIFPLDQSALPLSHSLNNTTVEAQTARVTQIMNKYTPIPIITSAQFISSSPVKQ